MNYQELVDKCKEEYNNNNLKGAYKYWCDLHNLLDEKLNQYDKNDEKNRYKCYQEFEKYIHKISNDEVYDITDYGKKQAYKQMELERTYSILDKSINLYEITKDNKMKSLMDFINFYEWCVLKSETDENKYNIYDLQTNCIVDDEDKSLNETIVRLVDRALDYEKYEGSEDLNDDEYKAFMQSRYMEDLFGIEEEYKEKLKEELEKELEYQEKRIEVCAYGKSDLHYIEHLKWKIDDLERGCE